MDIGQDPVQRIKEEQLFDFLTRLCRPDPRRKVLSSALYQRFLEHRTMYGTYDLFIGQREFTRLMIPMCHRLSLGHRRTQEGWCYFGIDIEGNTLSTVRPASSMTAEQKEEHAKAYHARYYQEHKLEIEAKRSAMSIIEHWLNKQGLYHDRIATLRYFNSYEVVYRNTEETIVWSQGDKLTNIERYVDLLATFTTNNIKYNTLRDNHMLPEEQVVSQQHDLFRSVYRTMMASRTEERVDIPPQPHVEIRQPRLRLRVIDGDPVRVDIPLTTPVHVPDSSHESADVPRTETLVVRTSLPRLTKPMENMSPRSIEQRMIEVSDRCDQLSPRSGEYRMLEAEYAQLEQFVTAKRALEMEKSRF